MQQYKNKVFPLAGRIQHYAWGGSGYLPELLDVNNPEGKPFAEFWMGAHDNGSAALVVNGVEKVQLSEYINSFPGDTLGKRVNEQFGRLPYLLKILDVKEMLSIQVHPTKQESEKEFARENEEGISLSAPTRNYKDDNHKPELMLALGEFWLLHGFKEEKLLDSILRQVPELNFLVPVFDGGNYRALYAAVMEMPQQEVNSRLEPLLLRILPFYDNSKLKKDSEDFWAARAAKTYNQPGIIDRGIFSIYFFNLLHLHEGEAIFQDAGVPHAYLEGQNVEIMANSDNVLRGGLTPKHVDVGELMKHTNFEATIPQIIQPVTAEAKFLRFPTPAPDFELSKLELAAGETVELTANTADIYFLLHGRLTIQEGKEKKFTLVAGQPFVAFSGAAWAISAKEPSTLFKAGVPGENN
jgi:mannose-6-phosphate isomerase